MALRSMTVHRYEEIDGDWRRARAYTRSHAPLAVRVARCVKCVTASAYHPMRRSRCPIRCG